MGRLDGKVAIVTGAASGFGRATAVLFAKEGASVVIGDVNEVRLAETVDQVETNGGRAEPVVGDVSTTEVARALVHRAVSAFGKLDILVNNAGIAQPTFQDTWDVDEDEWDTIIRTNLRSVFVCSKAAIPAMLDAGGGAIVNLSSISVSSAIGGSAYCASKGGMVSYSQYVADELARRNVRVNCVAPGMMRTPMSTGERLGLSPQEQDERITWLGQMVPLGFCGSVDDIAYAILFLASEEARYITARELVVDGGYLVRNMLTAPPPGGFGAGDHLS